MSMIAGHSAPPQQSRTTSGRFEAAAVPTDESDSSIDLADQIIHLVRSWSYIKAKMVSAADPEISSLFLIGQLVKDGPTRAKDLAGAICADQSTVSRQVASLVKAGLVERQADPDDGRASILVPTPLGVARLEKHFAHRGRALEPLVADWSEGERRQFLHLLRRFTSNLESYREEVAKTMTHSSTPAASPVSAAHADSGGRAQRHDHHVHPHASIERSN